MLIFSENKKIALKVIELELNIHFFYFFHFYYNFASIINTYLYNTPDEFLALETIWIEIKISVDMRVTTLLNFSTNSSLIYEKEKIESNSEPSIPGLVKRQLNAGFIQIGISDWAAENSNYTDLADRLKLAGKTDKQLFEQFQDANLDFRLKSKLAIRPVDGPELVFNLKQDRVI